MVKKKIGIIVTVIAISILASSLCVAFWYFSPINRINRAFEHGNYEFIVNEYGKLTNDVDKDNVRDRLLGIIDDYYKKYRDQEIDYEKAKNFAEKIAKGELKDDNKINRYVTLIDEIKTSRDAYDRALKNMNDGKYLDAIKNFSRVTKADKKCKKNADEKIEECKNIYCQNILDKADTFVSDNRFDEAKEIIAEGLEEFPDYEGFLNKLDEIEAKREAFDKENERITKGAALAGTWKMEYNMGNLIAKELGVSGDGIQFVISFDVVITDRTINISVDRNSIKPALDQLTANNMDVIYSVAEDYGVSKKEADILIRLTYKGSYSDFIMDTFGDEINSALNEYTIELDYYIDGSGIILENNENEKIYYKIDGDSLIFSGYTGSDYRLASFNYPLMLAR